MGGNGFHLDMDLNLGNDIDRDNITLGKDEDKVRDYKIRGRKQSQGRELP